MIDNSFYNVTYIVRMIHIVNHPNYICNIIKNNVNHPNYICHIIKFNVNHPNNVCNIIKTITKVTYIVRIIDISFY
jgi:hypothetical protein